MRGVAHDILAEARAAIEDPARSEAEAVHDFRRAMKRWRALLRLLEPFLKQDARRLRARWTAARPIAVVTVTFPRMRRMTEVVMTASSLLERVRSALR